MGKPNFQRLAELGQLPDYITPTVNEALAQVDAMRKEKKVVEKVEEETKKLEDMTKAELCAILEDMKLETKGNRKELIARIKENEQIKNVKEVEPTGTPGEFVDPLLK